MGSAAGEFRTTSSWQIHAASARGFAHCLNNRPGQDRFLCITFQHSGLHESVLLIAADGAGSVRKSWAGAWIACRAIAESVRQMVLTPNGQRRLNAAEAWTEGLAVELFAQARKKLISWAGRLNVPDQELATTLNMIFTGHGFWSFALLGDGLIASQAVRDESSWQILAFPQCGEFAGETTFLTSDQWIESMQFGAVSGNPDRMLITTDGLLPILYQSQTGIIHPSFVNPLFAAMESRKLSEARKNNELGKFLESKRIRTRCDDDLTLILAHRFKGEVDETSSAS
jgi:hypothetical protein